MHILWPDNVHEPGLTLTQNLLNSPLARLSGPGARAWASRVFFSDDGSTAVEVALKMAFRKYLKDAGLLEGAGMKGGTSLEGVPLHVSLHSHCQAELYHILTPALMFRL
jgi:dethiobiotin synthetase/adenosylmethionine--8-amino-7-oxononanoate aminotransferase